MSTKRPNPVEEFPEITPQVLHLRDLLKWVRQGRVRVPNFQRDFTWDRGRMLNLFDSIRKQYPIGTLLFWEPQTSRPSQDYLGPLRLPVNAQAPLFVLDGQQRLTTLAGVLLKDEMKTRTDGTDPGRWDVWYDAEADDFAYYEKNAPVSAVPVAQLMGTRGLYAAAQSIFTSPIKQSVADQWIQRMEAVSASLTAYRIPLVVFATDSLRLAVESFTRLNRSGQAMGADEMFSALTYEANDTGEVFRLSNYIDAMLANLAKLKFGEVDRVVALRIVLLAAGFDPFRTEWDRLARSARGGEVKNRLNSALDEASSGLTRAVEFLRQEGIRNIRLLPYSMQLVGLAAFFGRAEKKVTPAQLKLLRRWLWVTSFTEGFGGLNSSRVLVQLNCLRDVLPSDKNPTTISGIDLEAEAHPFPARHDHRSARVRALLCVMSRTPALKRDGDLISPARLSSRILSLGPQAMVRICRRSENVDTALLASPANRMFDVLDESDTFGKRWLTELLPTEDPDVLNSCFVSPAAWAALIRNDDQRFLRIREQSLMALEIDFMKSVGVTPYRTLESLPSAIDVEDSVPLSEAITVTDLDGFSAA